MNRKTTEPDEEKLQGGKLFIFLFLTFSCNRYATCKGVLDMAFGATEVVPYLKAHVTISAHRRGIQWYPPTVCANGVTLFAPTHWHFRPIA